LNLRSAIVLLATMIIMIGCSGRTSTAVIEIENDQANVGPRAEPVLVDPRVEVIANEYRRSSNDSNIIQRIKIRGPIMIVPAPAAGTVPMAK